MVVENFRFCEIWEDLNKRYGPLEELSDVTLGILADGLAQAIEEIESLLEK